MLTVRIIRALNLPRTDDGGRGKIDPFFVVKFAGQTYQTSKRQDDLNPKYNETFTFTDPPGRDTIQFELFDDEGPGRKPEYVGNASVNSEKLPNGIALLNLTSRVGRNCGQLEVEIVHTVVVQQSPPPHSAQKSLYVRIIRAQNLPYTDDGGRGKIDPFFVVKFAGQTYQTSKKQNDLTPHYNETFTFVDPPGKDIIHFELYDDEGHNRSEYIGSATVNSDKLPNGIAWLNLANKQGRNVGQLEVEITHTRSVQQPQVVVVQQSPPPIVQSPSVVVVQQSPPVQQRSVVVVQQSPPPKVVQQPSVVVVQQSPPPHGAQKSLYVRVIRAQNLPRTDDHGKGRIDPFFVVRFAGQTYQTSRRQNELNPNYNETFSFVDPPGKDIIHFELFDDECFKRSEYIGYASVNSDKLPNGIVWLNLTDKRGRNAGQLEVEVTHTRSVQPSSSPPPVVVVQRGGGGPPPHGQKKLTVRIIGARNLPPTDLGGLGKIDPFFIVKFAGQSFQTSKKQDNLNPNYNESLTFNDPPGKDILWFELWDDEGPQRQAKYVAKASVDSDRLPTGIAILELVDERGKNRGRVEVEITHMRW